MAEIIEVQEDLSNDEVIQPVTQQEPTTVDTSSSVEPEIPEKYKNKSLDEIVKMHQEAEKLIGRQAQEVGESRKLLDEYIKQQLNTTKNDVQPVQQEIDWFEDPNKAVNNAVENNPIVRQLKEQADMNLRQQQAAQLQTKFPDFQNIVTSEDFTNWIKGSKVRIDLFTKANNFDFDSAEELLETFTAIRGMKAQQAQQADTNMVKGEEQKRSQQIKSASVQKGGSGELSKPVYRRTDLIRLRMQDPERYNNMQDDIMQAYSEGRVK